MGIQPSDSHLNIKDIFDLFLSLNLACTELRLFEKYGNQAKNV